MSTTEIDNHSYRVGKLDVLQQLHLARRLAPMLAVMGVTAHQLMQGDTKEGIDGFMPLLAPITEIVARMTDEEANYIIFRCLAVVERAIPISASEVKYQHVSVQEQLMFQDMDMGTMLRLVVEVVKVNLGGFMKGLGDAAPSPSS